MSRSLQKGKPWADVRNVGGSLIVFGTYETEQEVRDVIDNRPDDERRIHRFPIYIPELSPDSAVDTNEFSEE